MQRGRHRNEKRNAPLASRHSPRCHSQLKSTRFRTRICHRLAILQWRTEPWFGVFRLGRCVAESRFGLTWVQAVSRSRRTGGNGLTGQGEARQGTSDRVVWQASYPARLPNPLSYRDLVRSGVLPCAFEVFILPLVAQNAPVVVRGRKRAVRGQHMPYSTSSRSPVGADACPKRCLAVSRFVTERVICRRRWSMSAISYRSGARQQSSRPERCTGVQPGAVAPVCLPWFLEESRVISEKGET